MKGGKRNTNTKNMLTFEKDNVIEGVPNHSHGFCFVEMSQCRNFSLTDPSPPPPHFDPKEYSWTSFNL